ncbi:hypothetical protein [Xanthobacter variabilis]|uniref:hypothetical protein n=1 Tax=Xanthobacter variabilis TaxID=3119932 RepID=UPI00372CA4DC
MTEASEIKQLRAALAAIYELASRGLIIDGLREEAETLFAQIESLARYEADVAGVELSKDADEAQHL